MTTFHSSSTVTIWNQCFERFSNDTILLTSNPRAPPFQDFFPEPSVSQFYHEEVRLSWWWPRCISRMHNARTRILRNPYWYQMTHLDDPHDGASLHGLLVSSLSLITLHVSWWLSVSPPPGAPLLLSSLHQPPAPASLQLVLASVCQVKGHRGRSVVTGDSRLAEDVEATHHSNTHSTHSEWLSTAQWHMSISHHNTLRFVSLIKYILANFARL